MEHQQRRPEYGTPKPDSGTEELDKHGETQSSAGTRESSAPRDRRFRSFRAEQQQELDEFVQWEEVLLEQEEYYGSELRPGEDGVHVHDPIDEMLADALPSNEEWNAALGIEPEDNWDVAGAS